MAQALTLMRTVTIAGLTDALPNVTAPAAGEIISLQPTTPNGSGRHTKGFNLVCDFTDNAGALVAAIPTATVDIQLWAKDAATGRWHCMVTETATNQRMKATGDIVGSDIWCLLLNVQNPGAATTIQVYVGEV